MNDYTNEIEEIRRRIDLLDVERRDLLGRLSILESKHQQQQRVALQQFSSQEKIYIFRQLFRGREDVFPKRWDNRKTGRSGYVQMNGYAVSVKSQESNAPNVPTKHLLKCPMM